jgi:hypothetical protein
VQHRGERKPDERRRKGAAENDDDRMDVIEHPQIATHQDQGGDDNDAGDQTQAGCDIHERTPNPNAARAPPARARRP